jgi:NAD(P)-dependent dehydrogenase (short-subunit alcohol dehydrogenase family)
MSSEVVNTNKTMIVTGGSQGIGAGVVRAFLDRGYRVVASSRNITKSHSFEASDRLAFVDGNIAEARTAETIIDLAMNRFGSIDALVNNAGIFFSKAFIEYTIEDLRALTSVNIEGFLFISQLAIRQMLGPEGWRQYRQYHVDIGGPSDRRGKCLSSNDHQGRPRGRHAESRDGIRQTGHPCECGCAGHRRHTDAR